MRLFVFVGTLLMSILAFAANPKQAQKHMLPKVFINGERVTDVVGFVQIDEDAKLIKAEIYDDPCGMLRAAGRVKCLKRPALRHIVIVPYGEPLNWCGSYVYVAPEGLSVANGVRHEVSVVDHSERLCRDLVPSQLILYFRTYQMSAGESSEYVLMK